MKKYSGKVVITTHFYKHQAYFEYVTSLMATIIAMERLGIKYDYWPVSGNFHMEMCFNDTLTRFMETEDATDLIMIDSDESWDGDHFIRLLMHDEPIVCGVYMQCNPHKKSYPVIFKIADDGSHLGKMLSDGNCLLEAERIPGGFLKVSKAALQKWADANPEEYFWFEGRKAYKFFTNEFRDHIFHGMDFTFSDKMREIGYKLWVDPIVEVKHWGITPFEGSLDAHLRLIKKNQEASGAFATIAQMAKEIEIEKLAEGVYRITEEFERMLCDYTGAPYAVAVDNCSNALFLALMREDVTGREISIPARTYPSVPCEIIHAGGKVNFLPMISESIKGAYRLSPTLIWDSSLRFTADMYLPGSFMCLSFTGPYKHLKLSKGGAILTDDYNAYLWFKRARYSGRRECSYHTDNLDMLGWNFYMMPEIAARGCLLMAQFYDREGKAIINPDIEMRYPDLSKFEVYR